MPSFLSRRKFIGNITTAGAGFYLGLSTVYSAIPKFSIIDDEKLAEWPEWKKYTDKIKHPCLTIKERDLEFARENIRMYSWAKDYASRAEKNAQRYHHLIDVAFLAKMIEETTPGDPLYTPCPSCRDQGKPVHPHGLWTWEIEHPDQLKCEMCGAIFPNANYPENIILHTKWRKPQTISYCGGDTFTIFGYKEGRPSFTANIRSRKVQWIANYCHTLAEAYALTGDVQYAISCKAILLRFADCYPNWLVHVGYGEYADMDPRIASENINNLPEPEICPPPNKPDKKLWTGYWSAGRASGVGLESDFVRKVVAAYDLTCSAKDAIGNPLYTDEDRQKIEHDLLLESTILLVCDKAINNKSVSNHSAAGLVGICVGNPELVRYGLNSFNKTVDGWYLSDGTSSESPFYGLMTLGGIWDMAQAARGYSDPTGYKDSDGNRLDSLDLYHHTNYGNVLDAFFKGLQGDLHFPPYADSFRNTSLDISYIELMVANYPERVQYLSLLKELCGNDLSAHSGSVMDTQSKTSETDEPVLTLPYDLTRPGGYLSFSFYYRKPGLELKTSPLLKFTDWAPPELRIGHLRTGNDGRESLLLMSASRWGIHHDIDSLNIYYWKKGYEILSDLCYLWDHPLKPQNKRTVAHNTVVIDEKDQLQKERGGEIRFFKTSDHVKAMEMSSDAYQEAKLYRRTSAIIDHGNGRNYVVDFFRVEGGEKQDFVFHASAPSCEVVGLNPHPSSDVKLYDFKNIRSADAATTWRTTWKSNEKMNCVAWSVSSKGERIYIADGWGQRDWKNSDIGATIPYIIRRCEGDGTKIFISVFEGYEGNEPFVRNVKLLDPKGVIKVETSIGSDYIMSATGTDTMRTGMGKENKNLTGHFAAVSFQSQKPVWEFVVIENDR
jgi:hypothetical protein